MNQLDLFIQYLTGDFDNNIQVTKEIEKGNQIHPEAVHIIRECNDKITNLPNNFGGRFVIEESYYTKPDKSKLIAPHLFLFELNDNGNVQLKSYQIPKDYTKEEFTYDNKDLKFDFNKLELSHNFGIMEYDFSEQKGFYGSLRNELGKDIVFTLTETISKDTLEVMELMEKGGIRLTPYDSPIVYNRVR